MIVAFANSKGGVGKSTLAVHLAGWCQERGRKVAVVDADVQGSSSAWLREASASIHVLRLCSADDVLEGVPDLASTFEMVVLDGPAGLSEVTRALLLVADCAVLPCGPSLLDLRAVQEALRVLKQAQQIRCGPPRAMILPNKVQVQYRLSQELMETLGSLGTSRLPALRLRQACAEAAGQGTFVWRLGPRGEDATREFHTIFEELMHHEQTTDDRRTAIRAG